jgi:hypothetical protein
MKLLRVVRRTVSFWLLKNPKMPVGVSDDGTIRSDIGCVDSHSPLSAHINPSFAEIATIQLLYHLKQFHLSHRMSLVGGREKDHDEL